MCVLQALARGLHPTALQVVGADGLFLCIHSHSGRQTSPTAEGKKPDGHFNL